MNTTPIPGSVGLIERNAQYTHTRGVRGAVAARQLDWANVTNMQSERLARRRLRLDVGRGTGALFAVSFPVSCKDGKLCKELQIGVPMYSHSFAATCLMMSCLECFSSKTRRVVTD